MARGISDLGNGLGYIYVTEVDGTTITRNVQNTCNNVRDVLKPLALQASPTGANRSATGTITVDFVALSGNITSIAINGINQIAANINVGLKTEEDVASDIADAFNAYSPTGVSYTAVVNGTLVTVIADESAGDTVNGLSIDVTTDDPGNIETTTTNIKDGVTAGGLYDPVCGYRFFLNADYSATPGTCAGEGTASIGDITNAIEITKDVIIQGLQRDALEEAKSILSGAVSNERQAMMSYLKVDTEGLAATDDLEYLEIAGYSEGDILMIYGTDASRVVTLKHGVNNLVLNGASDFSTSSPDEVIGLQKRGNSWYEMWRGTQSLSIPADSITTIELAIDAVETENILDANVTNPKLADGAVTTDKIEDGAVTPSKLANGSIGVDKLDSQTNQQLIVCNASFEADEQGDYKIKFPFDCEIQEISAAVYKTIEATEDATIIPKNHAGDVMGGGIINLPGGLSIGSAIDSLPTSNNTFSAGESMKLTTGKTTPGGKVIISIKLLKSGTGTGGTVLYQAPSFTSFLLVGYTTLEVGDSIPAGAQTFTWSTLNSGNVEANSIDIIDVTGGNTVLGSGLANDGTESLSLAGAITKTLIATHQFKIQGQNTQGGNFDRSHNVNWQFRKFFGNDSNVGPLSEVQVEALANNPLDSGFAGTYFFPGGDYKYFAFPVVWGTPTSFKDQATMLVVPMEAAYIVNLTNAFGVSQDYEVYRTTNIINADITIVVA